MDQVKSLLALRVKQCYRYLNEIGFGIIAVALFVLTGFIFNALQTILATPAIWAPIASLLLIIFVEFKRSDTFFLKSIFESKNQLRYFKFIENILVVSPIILFQAYFLNWEIILLILGICLLMAFSPNLLPQYQEQGRKTNIKTIPLSIFEIKFYLEKNKWGIVMIWVLLLLGGLHISLWILGIFFTVMLPIEIYTQHESREMIHYEHNFVYQKILRSTAFFAVFIVVPTILTLIIKPSSVYIILYGSIATFLSIILAISKKYSTYYGVSLYTPSNTSTMILTLLMLPPGGILITLSACIYYYIKAEKHMKKIYAIT